MIKKLLIAVVLFFSFIYSAECKKTNAQTENNYFYPVADTYVYEKRESFLFLIISGNVPVEWDLSGSDAESFNNV